MTFDCKKDKVEVILNVFSHFRQTFIQVSPPRKEFVSMLVGKQTVTNYSSTLQVICDVGKLDGTLSKKTCVSFQGDVCLSWNREMLILSNPYCFYCFTVLLSHVRPIMCPWKSASMGACAWKLRGEQRADLSS